MISDPFIGRPIGTALFSLGILLAGLVAYAFLPVAALPSVDFPTIRVSASWPGADPATMAAAVAGPLERRLGEIPGVTELTSTSSLGSTSIAVQFDLSRNVDKAARDVQAAINAAGSDLPSDLPSRPSFRKMNPAAAPILIIALTSRTVAPSALYDVADTVLAQRIAQVRGVGDVSVSGADQPAVRIRVDPAVIAPAGIALEDIRQAVADANSVSPVGDFEGRYQAEMIVTNPQLRKAEQFRSIIVKVSNGNTVRLGDIATVEDATRNRRSAAFYNGQPAILLNITKQGDANVIETVDGVLNLLPELKRWIPAGVTLSIVSDRTQTIRASVNDMQATLMATVVLVMLVVFLFLRRWAAVAAVGVTVPLALIGTFGGMWAAGFSVNNLSLMALAIAVGFVVDDAIVMVENVYRNMEQGLAPMAAARQGARQIAFTVMAISISLVAAFVPLFFMEGAPGRLFREFSLTLVFAIVISTFVSLTVTPTVCARYFKRRTRPPNRFDRFVESSLELLLSGYEQSLRAILRHIWLGLVAVLVILAATVTLYVKTPKGNIPQDDSSLVFGGTRAAPDVSFQAMMELQKQVADIVAADPAVEGTGSIVGGGGFGGEAANRGTLLVNLKENRDVTAFQVVDRLRRQLAHVVGVRLFLTPVQDVRVGGRQSDSAYQFTIKSTDVDQLVKWSPLVARAIAAVPGVTDVSADRDPGGLQLSLRVNRMEASRLGVSIAAIDAALNNSFAQRQVSVIYTQRNQYRVVLEVEPRLQTDPTDLGKIFVPGAGGVSVPLSAVLHTERTTAPLAIYHQDQFPSTTVSFALTPGTTLDSAVTNIQQAVAALHMPEIVRGSFEGDAGAFQKTALRQPLLILVALVAIYIVLGVLYESLVHPLTIISTLPSAGLGALLALQAAGSELNLIAFIGIILLIGIVKKNGIMMVDFALDAERNRGLPPAEAILSACVARFRPILMTTLAALLAAVPLMVATGPGSELRRPLGLTIVGGLAVSQLLTLYTTPMIYLLIDRLRRRPARKQVAV